MSKHPHILIITLSYEPDTAPNAYTMAALSQGLVELGNQVTVLAALPHYGATRVYDGYRGHLWMDEHIEDLRVIRTQLFVPPRSDWKLGKVLSWLSFNLIATPISLGLNDYDVVLATSPPLTLGLTEYLVSRLCNVPYIYNVQDIYPDVAIEQGVLQGSFLIRTMRRIEDFVYRHAASVTVITEGFRKNLLTKGVSPDMITVIPNLVDTELIQPGPRNNPFAAQYGLFGSFVVMYAGNVGESLGIETLVEVARRLQSHDGILMAVAGRGTALPRLRELCQSANLSNVHFLPFQGRENLSNLYASSDVQLIIQGAGFSRLSAPSKTYMIMSSGKPTIISMDQDGDTAKLIRDADCGIVVPPEDPDAIVEAILKLATDSQLLERMGRNARTYAVENYSKRATAQRYDRLIRSLV
jgi:colanic acid biosynthesis glycosyl transferase WcaI